ncbi:hypothetical protein CSIV_01630 [Microbacterium sp. CSI-V]|uniref:DUF4012 domain-containing protein n=1 Tax=unclassified Microbacterium TaxID=2609290 RepID=UPI00097BD4B1|nr:DUF4012 domain-containing protein [Microbacterium sp. CSI-V]MXS75309.1 DUF4012 domain-containing protein [Microbacterium sp. TL13]ONI66347.1 hypothetical protein CSIV_01630 [Microbacterium sp. CSI-V]
MILQTGAETRATRRTGRRTHRARRGVDGLTSKQPFARHAGAETTPQRWRRKTSVVVALIGGPLTVVILALAVAAGVFVWQVIQVRDDLEGAVAQSKELVRAAASGDVDGIQRSGGDIVAHAQRAYDTTQNPLWDFAAQIPAARTNIQAVRAVTDIAHTITSQSIPPVMTMMAASGGDNTGSGINLRPFLHAGAVIPTVLTSFDEASQIASGMDRTGVLPQISAPVDQLQSMIQQATPILTTVEEHLPEILRAAGAERPMLYQLMIQTPAEIRATGGGVAQWLVLKVDDGNVDMLSLDTGTDLMYTDLPSRGFDTVNGSLLRLPTETRQLYPPEMTNWSSNFNMSPDFPTAVELFQKTREWTDKPKFDGAFSIDPIVLAHLLEATGPITLASGETVDAQNAGSKLMSEPYERYGIDNAAMDRYFSEISAAMFSKLTGRQWDIGTMWNQVVRSAQEGRIYAWFDDSSLEGLAHQYGLDGTLQEDNTSSTQLGIYFNDYSIGKLEYHLTYSQFATCNADDRTITVSMELHNSITDAITSGYTLGLRNIERGIDLRTMMLDVLFFAPPGGKIVSTDPDEGDRWDSTFHDRSGSDHENPAVSRTLLLPEGATRTVSYTVKLPEGDLGPLELRHTPGANDTKVTIDPSCAPLFRSPEGSDNIMLSKIG